MINSKANSAKLHGKFPFCLASSQLEPSTNVQGQAGQVKLQAGKGEALLSTPPLEGAF